LGLTSCCGVAAAAVAPAQVFNELRARMSSLSNAQYVVLPLHVSSSREGGMIMVYPYAGVNLDTVCASLRLNNQKTELVTQLAQMATSVLLTLQKLQAQKPQVGLSGAPFQPVGVHPVGLQHRLHF
jgi:hypothetical protein